MVVRSKLEILESRLGVYNSNVSFEWSKVGS